MAQYAQITKLSAPSQAAPGARVAVTIEILNLASVPIIIEVGGAIDDGITSPWDSLLFDVETSIVVDPGVVAVFPGYFIMPARSVTICAYSYYWYTDGNYYFDDTKTEDVSVSATWLKVGNTLNISVSYDTPLSGQWLLVANKAISVSYGTALSGQWLEVGNTLNISVSYGTALSGQWLLVANKAISVSYDTPLSGQWLEVASKEISVTYSGQVMSGDWLLVAQKILTLNQPTPPPEGASNIPWGWIAAGVGGAAAIGVAVIASRKKQVVKSR